MDARELLALLEVERPRVLRQTRRKVASTAAAEEIVQRALSRAVEHAGQLRERSRAVLWFERIVRHALADHHRARRTDPLATPDPGELDALPNPEAPGGHPCPCAGRLLDELRPAYQELLRRIDLEGEPPSEVARSLGISVGNAQVRLHRARRSLRARVQGHCGVDRAGPCLDCGCTADRTCSGATRPPRR